MTDNENIRKLAAGVLSWLVEMGIPIQAIAVFLGTSRMSIHRWLGGFFLPSLKLCEAIEAFADLVGHVRKDWKDIIASYNGRYHPSVEATLYKPGTLRILKSKLNYSEKADKLTAMTFKSWEKSKRGKNELS
ncbi:hypothetical protein ES705_13248 [subsurface metagenome]